jgi:NADH-quinone oxidoreductase subunit H
MFALYSLAEYANILAICHFMNNLYLGGWHILPSVPFLDDQFAFLGIGAVKTALLFYAFIYFRAILPRFRYDQVTKLCWLVLLPISFINLIGAVVYVNFFF